jgi:hypothetical protein
MVLRRDLANELGGFDEDYCSGPLRLEMEQKEPTPRA